MLFFHVTARAPFWAFHSLPLLACTSHMLASAQGGLGGGVYTNNVPDDFKTVGHKGPCNFLFLFLFLLLLLLLTCCTRSLAYAQQGGGGGVQ